MVLSGIYLGVVRETFQRMSALWKHNRILLYVAEIIFWLLQTVIIFIVLYRVNYGDIRFYVFIALGLGYSMYIVLIQSFYKRVLNILIKLVRFTTNLIIQITTIIIIRPIQWLIMIVIALLSFIWTAIAFLFNGLLNLIARLFGKTNFHLFDKIKAICSTIINKLKQDGKD